MRAAGAAKRARSSALGAPRRATPRRPQRRRRAFRSRPAHHRPRRRRGRGRGRDRAPTAVTVTARAPAAVKLPPIISGAGLLAARSRSRRAARRGTRRAASGGAVTATSVHAGVAPIAARSLRLTAIGAPPDLARVEPGAPEVHVLDERVGRDRELAGARCEHGAIVTGRNQQLRRVTRSRRTFCTRANPRTERPQERVLAELAAASDRQPNFSRTLSKKPRDACTSSPEIWANSSSSSRCRWLSLRGRLDEARASADRRGRSRAGRARPCRAAGTRCPTACPP